VLVEAHVEARGANDHVGGLDGAAVGGFEQAFEDASDLALAALEKAGVVSVAIDGGAIGKVVVACNLVGAAPADEIAFDGVAIGLRTDGAAPRMAGEIGRSFGAERSWWLSGSWRRLLRSCCGGGVRGDELRGGHALFFGNLGVAFGDGHEFPLGGTEAVIGEFVERVGEVRLALSGGRFVHGGLVCGRAEARRRADPAAKWAEESLSTTGGFARPIVGYLVFRGALHALGYFLLLITIYHTWLGISRGSRVARFVFVGMPHLRARRDLPGRIAAARRVRGVSAAKL
jgi:hypothetical protein